MNLMRYHLIVSCSARKSLPSPRENSISTYIQDDLESTARNWLKLLTKDENSSVVHKVEKLYVGTSFLSLKELAYKYKFDLSVISAGFGLLRKDFNLPGYNATFSENNDRVPIPISAWWDTLVSDVNSDGKGRTSFKVMFKTHPNDKFIISCAKNYLFAIQNDLDEAINELNNPSEQLVIISSQLPTKLKKHSKCFLRANRFYKQNASFKRYGLAMNDRMLSSIATHLFIEQLSMNQIGFSDIIGRLNKQADRALSSNETTRQKKGKDHVINFIIKMLQEDSSVGVTKMHSQYRNAGFACSDKNFRQLFAQVKKLQG